MPCAKKPGLYTQTAGRYFGVSPLCLFFKNTGITISKLINLIYLMINVKAKDLLMAEETLFRNEEIFTPSYVPEDFMHRDGQLKALSLSLKPGLRGMSPMNTLVHGPPGTGKTTAIKFLLTQMSEVSGRLVPVYINCEDHHTRFSIFSRIHEEVYGHCPPDTGKPLETIKGKVFKKLTSEKKSLVVILDEFDTLFLEKTVDAVLLDILKAHATYGYDRVGIIGMMIDETHMVDLDLKTRSVFNPHRIFFQPYTSVEILDILSTRVKYGFYPDVLSKEILENITEKTFSQGDLRVGIDLLRVSAYLAEQDSSRKIKKEHVETAFERESRQVALKNTLSVLTKEEKKLLQIIAGAQEKSSGKIYELFRKETKIGIRKYNEIVTKLEHYNLIDTSYNEGAKGRSRNILLRYDSSEVLRLIR